VLYSLKLLTVDELLITDVEAEVSDVLALKKKEHKYYFQNNQNEIQKFYIVPNCLFVSRVY
jgi:hypothetical protein